MRILFAITRAEHAGAQAHLATLLQGLDDERRLVVGEEGWLTERARALGVPVRVLPSLLRDVAPGADLRATLALVRLLRQEPADLLHTHSTKAGAIGRLAAALTGTPCVHTVHGVPFAPGVPFGQRIVTRQVERALGRLPAWQIAVSEADREALVHVGAAREARVRVVHNGVPDVDARARPVEGDPPALVMVARLAPQKDHATLLAAAAGLDRPHRIVLVGDGPLREPLKATATALGLPVEWAGAREDVPELLAGCQVAVLASRYEGLPLFVLEAMRAGLPVVASDVGGVREAVVHQQTGLLVPPSRPVALGEAILRLLGDPLLRARLGAAGRARYESHFTARAMVASTRAVHDAVRRVSR